MTDFDLQGIGMTSQRTRDRLVARLREQGIDNNEVLACGGLCRDIFALTKPWLIGLTKIPRCLLAITKQSPSPLLWR